MSAAGDAILKLLLVGEDKSASAALGKVAAKAKETGEKAKASLGGIGGALGAIGGLAAAAGIVKFGKDAIGSFTEVGTESIKLSRLTGLPIEQASRLRFAFQQTGVDAETAGKSMGIFSKNLVNGSADKALSSLGMAVRDSTGKLKSMEDLLPGIADKFKGMPDGPEKTALAMQLFGKGGASMIPFLNKGADGIAALDAASDKYGLTISGPMADQIKKAKASQKDWDATVQGLSVTFGAVLLPVLTTALGYVRDNVVPIIQSATAFFSRHADEIGHVIQVVGPLVGIVAGVVGAIRVWTAVQGLLNVVMSMNPIGIVVIAIAALVAGVIWAYNNVGWFKDGVDLAFKGIAIIATWLWNNALQPFFKFLVEGMATSMRWIAGLLDALGKIPGFEWATEAAKKMRDGADAADKFAGNIKKIPENKTVTIGVTANYDAKAQTALSVARGNTKLSLPGYAAGGRPALNRPALFGENGVELWIPDTPGTVINANQTAAMLRGGGPSALGMGGSGGSAGATVYVTVQGDSDPYGAAKRIEQSLKELKVFRGGTLAF